MESLGKLRRAGFRAPLEAKVGEGMLEFFEAGAVGALISASFGAQLDFTSRNCLLRRFREVDHPPVQFIAAIVECFIMDLLLAELPRIGETCGLYLPHVQLVAKVRRSSRL